MWMKTRRKTWLVPYSVLHPEGPSMSLNEAIVEDVALSWFGEPDYAVGHGANIAPGESGAERS